MSRLILGIGEAWWVWLELTVSLESVLSHLFPPSADEKRTKKEDPIEPKSTLVE